MDITPWLKALEDSGLATAIRNSSYWFPCLEALHVMSLSLVLGTITVVDLRMLGLTSKGRSAERVSMEVLKWTWGGFALAVLTGVVMFTTNARVYANNTAFQIKLVLLVLAGLNMVDVPPDRGPVSHVAAGTGSRRRPSARRPRNPALWCCGSRSCSPGA